MAKQEKEIDLIVVGAGPAGLAAAIYGGRAKLDMIVLEEKIIGGQVRNSYTIENYPGFEKISGSELADIFQKQVESLGVTIDEFDLIENVELYEDKKIVETESYIYKPKSVIIATGASPKKIPVLNESKYQGKGVHYCAVCDGAIYEGKKIGVVGGGNSALEEAIFLTKFAEKVFIIRRHDYFNGEKSLIDEVLNHPKIEVLFNEDLVDLKGENFLDEVVIKNKNTGKLSNLKLDAVFGYIGTEPKTNGFDKYLKVNDYGYIITNEDMETNIDGVYAVGDVREKKYRQITTAVSDGTIALLNAEKYIVQKER
ncbi:NAD(P)/FAD-dependent oxidoreductase [Clostridium taeniosporum]|uniref:Thioredoxin-disulfide reductase n=1 Tax=Clostridium taeniosporum TaxID=394958 RepID=A0A1D7XG99_9CLOT|nr:FAD-dependent oxidoreductase [Clostridium taeniosporum]AOR22373.1 thioredoxin-disulfide reductase [Clostridium taeniosporum]